MDASAFRVREEACEPLSKAITALTLHKNDSGGYAYNDALIFEKQVERELERQHYEGADNGMKGLLGATPNSLNKAKSMKVYTRASILKASKAATKEATKAAKATSASRSSRRLRSSTMPKKRPIVSICSASQLLAPKKA